MDRIAETLSLPYAYGAYYSGCACAYEKVLTVCVSGPVQMEPYLVEVFYDCALMRSVMRRGVQRVYQAYLQHIHKIVLLHGETETKRDEALPQYSIHIH